MLASFFSLCLAFAFFSFVFCWRGCSRVPQLILRLSSPDQFTRSDSQLGQLLLDDHEFVLRNYPLCQLSFLPFSFSAKMIYDRGGPLTDTTVSLFFLSQLLSTNELAAQPKECQNEKELACLIDGCVFFSPFVSTVDDRVQVLSVSYYCYADDADCAAWRLSQDCSLILWSFRLLFFPFDIIFSFLQFIVYFFNYINWWDSGRRGAWAPCIYIKVYLIYRELCHLVQYTCPIVLLVISSL